MKNTLLISTLISLFFCSNVFGQTTLNNNFILRAGLSVNKTEMHTDKLIDNHETDEDGPEDETETLGLGLFSSIAYRFNNWEFAFASDVLFGKMKDITFIYNQSSIRGGGNTRSVSIGPQLKYITPYVLLERVRVYFGFGPSWSLQTFVFKNPQTTNSLNNKSRISFENYGGGLFIGFEEALSFKEMHPAFIEIGYNYLHSYKVSLLDASNSADVITLNEGDSNEFSAHTIIFRVGLTLF